MNHHAVFIKVAAELKQPFVVKNYIMISIDQGKPVSLSLLDVSAAFDTVDNNVLFLG